MTTEPQALLPTTIDALREELDRVRTQLAEYVGHEPTVREEMHHLGDENILLRKAVAFFMIEGTSKTSVDVWNDDLDYRVGRLDIERSPNRTDSTLFTFVANGVATRMPPRKPIDHRAEAEKHASLAAHVKSDREHHPIDPVATDFHLRMGLIHATLAKGEEGTAAVADMRDALTLLRRREYVTREAVSVHIAKALVSEDRDRWLAGRGLATALDEADANIDNAIDGHLADNGHDSKTAWNGPAVLVDDPWAPKRDITADVPASVRRVLAGRIASMLLSPENDELHERARGLAFALKGEGADLTDAIKEQINGMTLGFDPSEPPF